jgi:capsular exopolysaccharide synthesis family protein
MLVNPGDQNALELRDYFRVLLRHKWIIIVTMAVCVGASLALTFARPAQYSATTQVLLEQRLVDTLFVPGGGGGDTAGADRSRSNEIAVMDGPEVEAAVEEQLGYTPDPVAFEAQLGTDVVAITAQGPRPRRVAATADAYANTYIKLRIDQRVADLDGAVKAVEARVADVDTKIFLTGADLINNPPPPDVIVQGRNTTPTDKRILRLAEYERERDSYTAQLDDLRAAIAIASQPGAKVLSAAEVPTEPINKDPMRNLLAGIVVGLILAVALAFLREYLDDSVKTKEDLEAATGLNVLGIVPALGDWKKRNTTPLVALTQPRSPAAESYRSVRTSVEFLALDQPIGSIQVTSPQSSEGKTSTLANLAVTFARAGQRVIVVCCDLRRPRVHEFFGLSNRVGFTSVLLGDTPLVQAIQPAHPELPIGLLASGPLPPNPAELLASQRAIEVIEDLDQRCDVLLIDSPPILPVTDGLVISGLVDAVLVVGSAGSSTKRGLRRTTELLRQVDAPMIGAILNGVRSQMEYGSDDRYYTQDEPTRRRRSRSGGDRRVVGNGQADAVPSRPGPLPAPDGHPSPGRRPWPRSDRPLHPKASAGTPAGSSASSCCAARSTSACSRSRPSAPTSSCSTRSPWSRCCSPSRSRSPCASDGVTVIPPSSRSSSPRSRPSSSWPTCGTSWRTRCRVGGPTPPCTTSRDGHWSPSSGSSTSASRRVASSAPASSTSSPASCTRCSAPGGWSASSCSPGSASSASSCSPAPSASASPTATPGAT